MTPGIFYIRFSSKIQKLGTSEARQAENFTAFCTTYNLTRWAESFALVPKLLLGNALSGSYASSFRPLKRSFQRMRSQAELGNEGRVGPH
jgi:hypothetical protein